MDWNQVKAEWSELRGRAKKTWGRLTDDDLEVIKGKREILVGKLRKVYGLARNEAERQVAEFARSAGVAVGRAAGRTRSAGRNALTAATKAGRVALGAALDSASAGLDMVRDMITTEGPRAKPGQRAGRRRSDSRKTPGSGARGAKGTRRR